MLAMGGMKPLEVLRSATIGGADRARASIKQVGSIEPGKLADLLVLDKNPLEEYPKLGYDLDT